MKFSNSCQSFHNTGLLKNSQVQLTNSAQLDIDPLMHVCTLLILFWQCYKHGSERERTCAVKYSATFLICFVLGIFKIFMSSFHLLGQIYTTEHVNFWKNAHFLILSSAEQVKNRCEEAKIRFKDHFSNRLYFRSITMNKNNTQKILISPFSTICVSVALQQVSLLTFF